MDFSIIDEIIKMSKSFSVPYNKQTIVDSIVKKFNPIESQLQIIRESPEAIKGIEQETEFIELRDELYQKIEELKDQILKTSSIDNVTLRGNAQLTDNIKNVFENTFQNEIYIKQAKNFLEKLINL
jgi:Ethanolamine utilization protein EutJ (predicted chaperonin)